MSTVPNSTSANATSALQQAAQSIIAGTTGSSVDVNALVTALVNAKIAGQQSAIQTQTNSDNAQISAFGALLANLTQLQLALTSLSNGSTVSQFTATASGDGLTATAGTGTTPGTSAVAGTYSVGVKQIASGQVLTSKAFGATSPLGTGTLTLSVGGKTTTVAIDSAHNTVADIAAAINSSSNNPGVSATVVNGADGAHLVLHSTTSGAANAISVSVNETDGGTALSSLAVTSTAGTTPTMTGTTFNSGASTISGSGWTQSTAAQDAYFTIDGTPVTSSTNSNTTALTGVTLNLTAAAVGDTPQTLTIAQDTGSQMTAITGFVSAYNSFVQAVGTATQFDPSGATTGTLIGDPTVNQVSNSLSTIIASAIGTGASGLGLSSIGISLQADGTLSVDSAALGDALQNNQAAIAQVFNSTNGIGAQLNNIVTNQLSSQGSLSTRVSDLKTDLTGTGVNSVPTETAALNLYTTQITAQYNAQFTALNALMAQTNNNSQYLTQLFGGTNSQGALSANK